MLRCVVRYIMEKPCHADSVSAIVHSQNARNRAPQEAIPALWNCAQLYLIALCVSASSYASLSTAEVERRN